jgi:hypothetical protein
VNIEVEEKKICFLIFVAQNKKVIHRKLKKNAIVIILKEQLKK